MERRVREINKQHFRRKRWYKITTMMAALAAFCTTYALILPAITMSRQLICGMEEHMHTQDCYIQQSVLVCGLEETAGHAHTETCYMEQTDYVCGQEETEGHTHTDACYQEVIHNLCGREEGEVHTHSDLCMTEQQRLVCCLAETPGHSHGDGCYTQTTENICGQEESDLHTHDQQCVAYGQQLTCSLEECQGHTHGDGCYESELVAACGLEEGAVHTHTQECTEVERMLICGLEESPSHVHSETCQGMVPVLCCILPEEAPHSHDESCYGLEDVLSCGLEEHTHSEFCYDIGPADPAADVENPSDWEQMAKDLDGSNAEKVVALALSQLGYRESNRNYVYIDELTLNGYTRYGDWYGDPYGDWNAMFASFVLHYAGVDDLGQAADPAAWAEQIAWDMPRRCLSAEAYTPTGGELVFLDRDMDGGIDSVAILTSVEETTWQLTAGDMDDAVAQEYFAPGDGRIVAWGLLEDEELPPTYTLTYDANNGSGETLTQQSSGEVVLGWQGLADPEGRELLCWNTAPDGTGTDCYDGEALILTEDLTLYAQWTEPLPVWSTFDLRNTAAAATPTIDLSKQIEWTGANEDDYSYRLHLTMDGGALSAGSVTTVTPTEKRNIGILIDVTETMLSTWTGSETQNKFDAVRSLLEGSDGFLSSILDGNTHVSIIVVGGQSGYATYTELSKEIASGESIGDFSNINNSLHKAQGISYTTGLKAAEKYLGNNIDSLVYIVGNAPDTYVKYSDGTLDRGTTGTQAQTKNYNDYVTFMNNHPELSMYMLGITPVERGSETAQKMGAYSVERGTGGGYYEAGNTEQLKQQLQNIAQQIVVPADKVKGITISDPLSEYVTLNGDGNITAQLVKLDGDGNITGTTDITDKVSSTGGLLTCAYADEIEGPFRIEIGFDIQLTDNVFGESYVHRGDDDTDWGTNTTSSNQPGYYSNGEATATYTLNNNSTATTSDFPNPVVQAPQKATIQVTKIWEEAEDSDRQPVTVTLHRGSPTGETAGTLILGPDSWTAECQLQVYQSEENQEKNNIYLVETPVDGFTPSYSVEFVEMMAGQNYQLTVTNTKQVVERSASVTVHKLWQGVPGTQDAVIHVCTGEGVSTYTDVGEPFRVANSQEASKTFTITWTGETPPTVYVYEEHSDQFYPVTGGDGEAQNIVVGEQQHPARVLTVEKDGSYTVTLTNMAVAQMPATGGPGTEMYVFCGAALIFSALLLMQIQKRKTERRAYESSFH